MFAARNLQRCCLRRVSSLLNTTFSQDVVFSRKTNCSFSNDVINPMNSSWGSCNWSNRWMSTAKGRSMRSKVERRMQKESGKTLKEIRRAKSVRKKLMTEEERLVFNLRRAKKKVALLLQKLKKYELPELPPPKHDPELLTPEQLQAYKKIGFRNKNYAPVGVRGVFGGVVQNMHLHWKFHETVQVSCDNFPKERIKEMATMLARLSGGIVINIHNVKTIIMFRGRNYRQPKNLIPINTLTKRKALFKARFEQALESQKLNIKKYETALRQKGINPDDPTAMAGILRVASTFFNAMDEKQGSPYVFRGEGESGRESEKFVEHSEPGDLQQEQEELDRFIAEIENDAEKEWAAGEAAEKEEICRIRYRNRGDFGGRFVPERYRDDYSDEERRGGSLGWKDAPRRPRMSENDDDDDGYDAVSEDIDRSESNDSDEDRFRSKSSRVERQRLDRTQEGYNNKRFQKGAESKLRIKVAGEVREPEEMFSDLDKEMLESDPEEQNLRASNNQYHSGSDDEEDYDLLKRDKDNEASTTDDSDIDTDDLDEAETDFESSIPRSRKIDGTRRANRNGFKGKFQTNFSRKMVRNESEIDDMLSDAETSMWESEKEEDFGAVRAADDDYDGGESYYHLREGKNRDYERERTSQKQKDETWDSD